jgi:hypothetical protein
MTVAGYTARRSEAGTAISRSIWTWARLAGGAAILAVLVWRVGAGPFVDGGPRRRGVRHGLPVDF